MIARFLATTANGSASLHEYPLPVAQAVAETLRQGGLRICWYPVQEPAPIAVTVSQPPRRERKRAERERRRQFAELVVIALVLLVLVPGPALIWGSGGAL